MKKNLSKLLFVGLGWFLAFTGGAQPVITSQPASQTVAWGSNVTFSVAATGTGSLAYQWQFNGLTIANGTGATLTLTNLQLTNQGSYSAVVSDTISSVTSSNANLTVVDMAAALNITNLIWTTGGNMPWFVQANPAAYDPENMGWHVTHDGVASMQSGNAAGGQSSYLQTTITGPATLTFWWQHVAVVNYDYLTFSLNGVVLMKTSDASDYWSQPVIYLGGGTNVVQWNFVTPSDISKQSAAWVDQVAVTAGGTAPILTLSPASQTMPVGTNTVFNAAATGTPPFTYQWRLNGTNIANGTNAALTLTNLNLSNEGNYDAVISNGFGATNTASAFLNVVDLTEALNATNLTWTTGGNVPWFSETAVNHDSLAAAQSGIISSGQTSWLQTTVTGPGTLTYWWNVSSEGASNYLDFTIGGVEQARIAGVITLGFYGWQLQTNYLGAGTQTVQWTYIKTDSGISNSGRDSGWLDQVGYVAGGTAPYMTLNPSNQVVLLGSNVTLNAAVMGTPPLNCQWQLNQANLPGATNASLALMNAQFTNEGTYILVVSNAFGTVSTPAAYLNVVDFAEALNATNFTWSSAGNQPWFPETSTNHDGIAALQSGAITGNQQSIVQTTVTGPGTLSYWWKVSSETNNDYVLFAVDGMVQGIISGTVNWQQFTKFIGFGLHTNTWCYLKNATVNGGYDAAWLDQVSFAPGPDIIITNQPASQVAVTGTSPTFSVAVSGSTPLGYSWYSAGTNLLQTGPSSTFTLPGISTNDAGNYSVVITNVYGSVTSQVAVLTVALPPAVVSQPASQTILSGSNVSFSVTAGGTGPFTYQWQCNGTNLLNNIITTVAGNGSTTYNGDGIAATNASLYYPEGVGFDVAGNLYIADHIHNLIRKVDANGIITTVAGNGTNIFAGDGGAATNASLHSPSGMAWDAAGNMYIVDQANSSIRKVAANGIITTVAGKGSYGFSGDGGAATNANLSSPYGMAVDAAGNLFIGDQSNGRIRKVATNGIITTVAGKSGTGFSGDGGAATNAYLNNPGDVVLDAQGNVYFADAYNNRIRKVATNGIITTVAGKGSSGFSGDGGAATNATLGIPYAVTMDALGNLFIGEWGNTRVRKVDTNGIITTVAGGGSGGDGGTATNAALSGPQGMAFDAAGNMYIGDWGHHCIRKVNFPGYPVLTLPGASITNAGNYSVVISSSYGSVTSSVVSLTVVVPPTIQISNQTNGRFTFVWNAASNQTYQLQSATNLFAPNWQDLGSAVTATNNSVSTVDTNGAASQRFYRVRLWP